jgi:hypothetical protein
MKKLLVVAVLVAIGAVVYVKVIRDKPAERVCEHLQKACGPSIAEKCDQKMEDVAKLYGDKAMDKAVDCMDDANSCAEAVGCLVGAGAGMVDEFKKGVERGIRQ